jgi:twinkle protein
MSHVIDRLPHECGTKRGLVVFNEDGRISGYCFSCGTFVPHPLGEGVKPEDLPKPKIKSPEQVQAELAEIDGYPVVDLIERKLRANNLDKFGVKVGLSEQDGTTPVEEYFPYTRDGKLVGYKVKPLGEASHLSPYWVGDAKDVDLFNWETARKSGAYRLYITEGENDSVALDRIMEMYGKEEYTPAIVSLPHGAGSARKSLQKHAAEIKNLFKEVVFVFDDDRTGQEAVQQAMLVLPNAKSVKLPEKDANDCLLAGKAKAAYNALSFQLHKPKNTRIVTGYEMHDKAKEPAKWGELTWPWARMNDDLRGIRLGETIYTGGGTKIGKTTMKNALGAHFISKDKTKVFMACPEESNAMTYKLMANQLTGKIFHDPKVEFDEEAYEEAGEILKDNLFMLNLYQHLGWNTLKDDIVAAVGEGCKAVIIDPITNLSNGVSAGEANTMLQEFAQELSAMAMDLNFTAFLFAHLKASEGQISQDKRHSYYAKGQYVDLGNCSHEMGGSIYSSQFAGSRAMQRSCNLMLGLLGNKDPELPDNIRNTREIRVLEDRAYGTSGVYPLYWNRNTGQFKEI